MRLFFWTMAIMAIMASAAHADENDLSGGALIVHSIPELAASEDPGTLCTDYETYALAAVGDQVTRIDGDGTAPSLWFVIATWTEDKCFKAFQFGLGDYDDAVYPFSFYGPCAPAGGELLELPSPTWPDPNQGIAVTAAAGEWSGNFIPVYYFGGYAYTGTTTIALGYDMTVPDIFGGFTNCETSPPRSFVAGQFGAVGINTAGVNALPGVPIRACCVDEECTLTTESECQALGGSWKVDTGTCGGDPCATPVDGVSWGTIKSLYR